jgi:hypothetical protein
MSALAPSKLIYPELKTRLRNLTPGTSSISNSKQSNGFRRLKECIILVGTISDNRKGSEASGLREAVEHIIDSKSSLQSFRDHMKEQETWSDKMKSWIPSSFRSEGIIDIAHRANSSTSDVEFLKSLDGRVAAEPLLQPLATRALDIAHSHFQDFITGNLKELHPEIMRIQEKRLQDRLKRSSATREEMSRKSSLESLIRSLESETCGDPHTQ